MDANGLARYEALCNAVFRWVTPPLPVAARDPEFVLLHTAFCQCRTRRPTNHVGREAAQKELVQITETAGFIPKSQFIFLNSKNSYALMVAAKSLSKLVRAHATAGAAHAPVDPPPAPRQRTFVLVDTHQRAARPWARAVGQ